MSKTGYADTVYLILSLDGDKENLVIPFDDRDLSLEENWNQANALRQTMEPRGSAVKEVVAIDSMGKPVIHKFSETDLVRATLMMLEDFKEPGEDEVDPTLASFLKKQNL